MLPGAAVVEITAYQIVKSNVINALQWAASMEFGMHLYNHIVSSANSGNYVPTQNPGYPNTGCQGGCS